MASKSFFTEQITGLYNGVSTTPDLLRLENQAEEQINFVSDISRGLESRNGTELIKPIEVSSNINSNSLITKIDRNTKASYDSTITGAKQFSDDYIVCFTGVEHDSGTNPNGAIEIFDKNGVKQTLSNPEDTDYLITTTPNKSIRTALIEDYMIVVNTETKTAMTTNEDTNTFNDNTAIIVVEGNPSANFTLYIKRGSASRETITTTGLTSSSTFNAIATEIKAQIDAKTSLDVTVTVTENIVKIKSNTDSISTYQFYTEDKLLDTKINIINQNVASASSLPKLSGYDGYILNITGVDEQNTLANYYVKWNATKQVWEETVEPGLDFSIDATKMPHFLVKTSEGTTPGDADFGVATFKFVQAGDSELTNQTSAASYADRLVGDNDSNPLPSFIGKRIVDITFFRNRLVYLGEDSLVMSRSNDYFNLFNKSAVFSAADDPIDIFIGTNFSVLPRFMEQYQGGIIVFTENAQFNVSSGDQTLSPATVRLEKITDYKVNEDVHPVRIGENTYFADSLGANAVIRKYVVKENQLVKDAISITDHVSTYIPKDLKFILGVPNKGMVIVAPLDDAKTLYVYISQTVGGKLVQSAWSKFTFNFDVYGMVVFDDELYFIDKSGENRNISKVNLFDHSKELQVDQFIEKDSTNYTITESTSNNIFNYTMPFKVEEDNTLQCFATVNNKLKDIFATRVIEVTAPDGGTINYSSKIEVPSLESYVPTSINLTRSWIKAYNGDYNEFNPANSISDKAYKLLSGTSKLIDYNSATGKYEIKGLGLDVNHADFVSSSSRANLNSSSGTNTYTRTVGGILPSQTRASDGTVDNTDTTTNNNTWLMNLKIGSSTVEKSSFLRFIGSDSGVTGNYISVGASTPAGGVNSKPMVCWSTTVYLDATTTSDAAIFATDSRNSTSQEHIVFSKVGITTDAEIQIRAGAANYKFYVDALFDNNWHDIKIDWFYGILKVTDNGVSVPIYDRKRLESGRQELNSINYVSNIEAKLGTVSRLGSENSSSKVITGYMAEWKYEEKEYNGGFATTGSTTSVTLSDYNALVSRYANYIYFTQGDRISLPSHTLNNDFLITLIGTFNSAESDTILYTNNPDMNGITTDEIFNITKVGTTTWTKLSFIPKNSTAHKIFEPLDQTIQYFWTHLGGVGKKITGLTLTHSLALPEQVQISWGDGEGEVAPSGTTIDHTYTEAGVTQYVDGTESIYFDGLYTGTQKRVDIKYTNGTVNVYLDGSVVSTYASADTTTAKSTITTYDGFTSDYTDGSLFSGDKLTVTTDMTTLGKPPTSLSYEYSTVADIRLFKINGQVEYRFEGTDVYIEDEYSSSKNAGNGVGSGFTRTTNSATDATLVKYDFTSNLDEDSTAGADADGVKTGSKITNSGTLGTNWDGKSEINSVIKYSDCWILPPEITYYERKLSFGYPTESSYTMSPYFLKRKKEAITAGRLNIKSLDISFQEAVNFFLEVQLTGRDTYTKEYSSKVGLTTTDTPNITKGTHKFGLNSDAENITLTIKNNSPYRSRFIALGYEGTFINRSKIR